MTKGNWRLVFRTMCLGIALFALGGAANAGTIYRGTLDPVFYNGFAEIDVGADCIRTGTGIFFVQPGIDCSDAVDFLDASITITDSPLAPFTVTWGFQANGVTGLLWDNGSLLAIDGGPFHSAMPPGAYDLTFNSETMTASVTCRTTSPAILDSTDDTVDLCGDLATSTARQEGFDPVPEPGTLALIAGALGAGWVTRRRRKS